MCTLHAMTGARDPLCRLEADSSACDVVFLDGHRLPDTGACFLLLYGIRGAPRPRAGVPSGGAVSVYVRMAHTH